MVTLADVTQMEQSCEARFHVAEGAEWATTDEIVTPIADFVDYLRKLPWPGTLTLTATFRHDK